MTLRAFCCLDMGAALSHHQEGESCDAAVITQPPTMADVIRERKKKAGGAGLGTLRRRIAAATRRPRDQRPDRDCEHARLIRSIVSSWRLAEVFLLLEELEAAAALRDLAVQGELAREPAGGLAGALRGARGDRSWCDVELVGAGWSLVCHRAMLRARTDYYRDLLRNYPNGPCRIPLEGPLASLSREDMSALINVIYGNDHDSVELGPSEWSHGPGSSLAAVIGLSRRPLAQDMAALLHSGAEADVRLVFVEEGGSCVREMAAHRFVLAARSRFFRNILSRGASSVCLDGQVVPARFAPALLHAAYTDQVDLSLIGRTGTSPSNGNNGSNSPWSSYGRGGSRSTAWLEDAFTLYEIAKFLELTIAVQGCEDVIAEGLSCETLPSVLRWSQAAHASQWLKRQGQRYLLDEFPSIFSSASCGLVPAAQLAAAAGSGDLQASELQLIRGLLKWADTKPDAPPSHGAGAGGPGGGPGGGGRRRRALPDAALAQRLAPLVPLVRTEHLPPDTDMLQQLIRRGIFPSTVSVATPGNTADAWLGRGGFRSVRCYQPYLDELRALLEGQSVPEAELARLRRQKYVHRIPDTLYMLSESSPAPPAPPLPPCPPWLALVPPRVVSLLVSRARELQQSGAAVRAGEEARKQIALRAVREASLPDECATLLLEQLDSHDQEARELSRGGSARCSSASLRSLAPLNNEGSRCSTGRRDMINRPTDAGRQSLPRGASVCPLPDVALAPNGNTHLLTTRDYYHHLLTPERGAVLQLDLGDGATHTPRPGSRAQRATRPNQHSQLQALSCTRSRMEDDEARAEMACRVYPGERRASPGRGHRQTHHRGMGGAGGVGGAGGGASGGGGAGGGASSGAYAESGQYRHYRLSHSPSRGASPRLA